MTTAKQLRMYHVVCTTSTTRDDLPIEIVIDATDLRAAKAYVQRVHGDNDPQILCLDDAVQS